MLAIEESFFRRTDSSGTTRESLLRSSQGHMVTLEALRTMRKRFSSVVLRWDHSISKIGKWSSTLMQVPSLGEVREYGFGPSEQPWSAPGFR